jgi:hypothetical protein
MDAALLWLVHSNTKNQDSPLYPNNPPLMTILSSNLKNEQIQQKYMYTYKNITLLTMDQTYKNNLTYTSIL